MKEASNHEGPKNAKPILIQNGSREVSRISFQKLTMLPNVLPLEASHSSLDIFERSTVLITFDSSFEQKIGPIYSPNGPTLEFEVVGDRNAAQIYDMTQQVQPTQTIPSLLILLFTRFFRNVQLLLME